LRYDKRPGDRFVLPTPQGLRQVAVAAVYYDYASNQGTVLMDGRMFQRLFGEDPAASPSTLSIYVRGGADPEAVRQRLAHGAGALQDLYFASNENVRREAMRIFDSTFTITYALELIAIVIAGLGVVSTLITLIYERQREIALLAMVGATPGQLRGMVVVEAVIIGGVSQLCGILLGLALALVLIYVINVQSFGWTIQFHLPLGFLGQSTLLVLAVTALWGLYPAARAANIRAIEVVREQ
jgi:putative ABC transport system permease protein